MGRRKGGGGGTRRSRLPYDPVKAKRARDKDNADLACALPHLDERQRTWLATAITGVHSGPAWLDRLGWPG